MKHVSEIKKQVRDSNMKTRTIPAALAAFISLLAAAVSAQVTVTTVINSGLHEPYGVVVDGLGNTYVSDSANNRIVRVDASTQAASTWAGIAGEAGSNDGPPDLAHFNSPQGLLTVSIGGVSGLLVADSGNNLIRFVRFSDGVVTTLAGQTAGGPAVNAAGSSATFHSPIGLDQDANGNVYIADFGNNAIRVMKLNDPAFGITNVVISGTSFYHPAAVAFAGANQLWVADTGNQMLKLVTLATPTSGSLTTYVGGYRLTGATDTAFGPNARFNGPKGLLWLSGVGLLISDTLNNSIRLATNNPAPAYGATNYAVVTFAGTPGVGNGGLQDGSAATAKFNSPIGLAQDLANNAFLVADLKNNAIRRIQTGPSRHPFNPLGIALNTSGSKLYIADRSSNAVQVLNLGNNLTETFLDATAGILQPVDVVVDATNNIYVLNQGTGGNGSILQFDQFGNLLRTNAAGLALPTALAVDNFGNVFVAQQGGAVQQFNSGASNTLFTITHAGVQLEGIALFSDGTIALSDAGNHVIWQVNPVTHAVTLLTGTPGVPGTTLGAASFAKLNQPHRLARAAGNLLVATDYGNNRLVVVSRDGSITSVLNSGTASVWYGRSDDPQASSATQLIPMVAPVGVALGSDGGVYASEVVNMDIRKIPGTGLLPPPPLPYLHLLRSPLGIALDTSGSKLYIADPGSNAVQVLNLGNNQTETFLDASVGILQPVDVAVDATNNIYVLNQGTGGNGFILEFNQFGNLLRTNAAGLTLPTALAVDSFGNIFVTGQGGAVQQFSSGSAKTLFTIPQAGVQLQGIALFDDGTVAVSDAGNHVIWQANPLTQAVTLLTGTPGVPGKTLGAASFARLNQPYRLARAAGNLLLASDYGNNRLVVVDRAGSITNVLNSTNAAVWFGRSDDPQASSATQLIPMVAPVGLAVGNDGGVYASEVVNKDIRKIPGSGLLPPPQGGLAVAPLLSPNSGYYPMGQTITVSSHYPSVYYTVDGSEPATNSLVVAMTNNIGLIQWLNPTNDLRGLRVKAFIPGGASDTVVGQPATLNTIGVPPDFKRAIYAGIGSQIVVPVVVNLQANATIKSYQFRVEIAPTGSAQPILSGFDVLSIGANDFIPLAAAGGNISAQYYTNGSAAGLEISAIGINAGVSFQNFAVVALLRIAIPYGANEGDSYALAVSYPSATADGVSASVPLTPMAPATILVTNIVYKVGDSASILGGWYNAGGFGNGDLDNSDVNPAFYASLGERVPYAFSDIFNCMDTYPVDATGFVGGDGQIRFLDWNVILQRSLRLDPKNWARAWSPGGNLVDVPTTLTAAKAKAIQSKSASPWASYRQALIGAVSTGNAVAGSTVNVPAYVKLSDGAMLSGVQFRVAVTPQGGAPALMQAPQLAVAPGVPGPTLQQSFSAGEAGFGWSLGSFDYLSRSSNFLGWVSFTIPATAHSGQTYSVSFANADGAPNLSAQYDFETRSAVVAVGGSAAPASLCSDEWKIHFFGSLANPSAADLADADGDRVPNWSEYLAGTDPTDPNSRLQLSGVVSPAVKAQSQMALQWLTAPGKAYEVQWSANLAGSWWNALATVSGDGTVASCFDTNLTATVRYYRLRVLP